MVHLIVRDDTFRFVVISATGIKVPIKARKIAARYFDPNPMSRIEVIAGDHGLQCYFIHFAGLHPDVWFVVSIAITHALDRFVEIECTAIREDVDQFDREISIGG